MGFGGKRSTDAWYSQSGELHSFVKTARPTWIIPYFMLVARILPYLAQGSGTLLRPFISPAQGLGEYSIKTDRTRGQGEPHYIFSESHKLRNYIQISGNGAYPIPAAARNGTGKPDMSRHPPAL